MFSLALCGYLYIHALSRWTSHKCTPTHRDCTITGPHSSPTGLLKHTCITEKGLPLHCYNNHIPLTPCFFKETAEIYTKFTKATPIAHASDDVIVKWLPLINAHIYCVHYQCSVSSRLVICADCTVSTTPLDLQYTWSVSAS